MGVKSLWSLLTPVGRPVMLETVEGKAMAIDSSIWLYQFQATMRDKEGRALNNAHLVGFLRRISKLLFYGIKPVFVFDGGAPALKRSTLNERRKKKSGAALSHMKLAEKLLAAQMRKEALNHAGNARKSKGKGKETEVILNEDTVYLEDIDGSAPRTPAKRQPPTPSSSTKKKDQYHDRDPYSLPQVDMEEAIAKATQSAAPDPRLATEDELRTFIEEMRPEDFDINSAAFRELPTEIQYEIIGDLRLKSRQTSYARLHKMLKNARTPLDFSKQQINNLRQRNALTQQLLMTTDSIGKAHIAIPIRIASERNREYVLMKNESVDGGWILGIKDIGTREKPIVLDHDEETVPVQDEDSDADMEEVEVPVSVPADPDLTHYRREMALGAISKRNPLEKPSRSVSRHIMRKTKSSAFMEIYDNDDELPQLDFDEAHDDNDLLAFALQESYDQSKATKSSSKSKSNPESLTGTVTPGDDFYEDFTTPSRLKTVVSLANTAPNRLQSSPSRTSKGSSIFGNPILLPSPSVPIHFNGPEIRSGEGRLSDQWSSEPIQSENTHPLSSVNISQDQDAPLIPAHKESILSFPLSSDLLSTPKSPDSTQPSFTLSGGLLEVSTEEENEVEKFAVNTDNKACNGPELKEAQTIQNSRLSVPQMITHTSNETTTMVAKNQVPFNMEPTPAFFLSGSLLQTTNKEQNLPLSYQTTSNSDDDMERLVESTSRDFKASGRDDVPIDVPSIPSPPSTPPEQTSWMDTALPSTRSLPQEAQEAHNSDEEEEELFAWSRTPSPIRESGASPGFPPVLEGWDAAEEMDAHVEEGEFARFMSQIKGKDVDDVRKEIDEEIKSLNQQRKNAMRDSEDITQQMIAQIMTMLRLFGIPYITAPMEAEAQCAELLTLSLVDGVITDDSDVFLFGAQRVYKNMFNQSKTVECFLITDLSRELGLDRDTLIQLAYLLGSDYTEGLLGVGPVVAMELLKEFPGQNGLHKFKDWWTKVQSGKDRPEDTQSTFRKQFKKKFKNLYLANDWPNSIVRDAYYHPIVDSSEEPFKWGMPDLDGLRLFLRQELGWGQTKVDELLLPIIQRMNKRNQVAALNKQGNLNEFLDISAGGGTHAPRQSRAYQSKRLQQVISDFRKRRKGSVEPSASSSGPTLETPEYGKDSGSPISSDAEQPKAKRQKRAGSSSGNTKEIKVKDKGKGLDASTRQRKAQQKGQNGRPDEDDDEFIPAYTEEPELRREKELNLRPRPKPKPKGRSNNPGQRLSTPSTDEAQFSTMSSNGL